jgi:type II restriction/modification system DNA methylase subunit YeeA
MNKSALKTFAISARKELLKKVEAKAMKIGITEDNIKKADIESSDAIYIDGRQLSKEEKIQRDKLIARINQIGFKQVMEEVAYTWFNRLTALRFMEVNEYLPSGVRVLSSSNPNSVDPDMLNEALELDLEIELDKEYIYELKINNKIEELFKYLIIKHCNDLNRFLPFMFEKIDDYTEILFPEGLLAKDSFISQMADTEVILEANWKQVEIIGWLYQFYISEKKDQVFANLKKNIKINKDTLPAATQLFTPNWIVKYMVENSLGRIWVEGYPESNLKNGWNYYIDEPKQEKDVLKQLAEIRHQEVNLESISFVDPSCGSGHILVYAFDLFFDMYLERGYIIHEIPKLILEKNLFGLDIDDRAVQLASFAVMMKAREKSRRVFDQDIQLNICAIQESNWITDDIIERFSKGDIAISEIFTDIKETFIDAKEYGSILSVRKQNYELLQERLNDTKENYTNLFDMIENQILEKKLPNLILQSKILSSKFDVVATNPPYMGHTSMAVKLSNFVKRNYPISKSDLFAVFIEKCNDLTKNGSFQSMITQQSWMFLSTYENLRKSFLKNDIVNMLHLGSKAFEEIGGEIVQTTAFISRKSDIPLYEAIYFNLIDYTSQKSKEEAFIAKENQFYSNKKSFETLPGHSVGYWVTKELKNAFMKGKDITEFIDSFQGIITGDNNKFLRKWTEVDCTKIPFYASDMNEIDLEFQYWVPYNKGGEFRKWYGNQDYVINWKNGPDDKTRGKKSFKEYYLREYVSWSYTVSSTIACRYYPNGFLWDVRGSGIFDKTNYLYYLQALISSKVGMSLFRVINSTLSCQVENILLFPILDNPNKKPLIDELVKRNIDIARYEWDSSEISWDFRISPLLKFKTTSNLIFDAFNEYREFCVKQFNELRENEEELNNIFIQLYDLQNELNPEVENSDITIGVTELSSEIINFISFAIGCIFGRYSLNEEGLIFAGGEFDTSRYKKYNVDKDNILPILPGAYFEDDIVTKFIEFVKITFSEETLPENLDFIADTLGKKKGETAKETITRFFLNDFFKNHVQIYKNKPIYWLFTSGKQKAFNCLIYMHRYDKTTLSRIRTDYLHEYQIRLDAEKKDLFSIIEGDYSTKEISNAKKELKALDKKIEELKEYDELLHHMADMQIDIDLDDGVVLNYEKFKGLVAKI